MGPGKLEKERGQASTGGQPALWEGDNRILLVQAETKKEDRKSPGITLPVRNSGSYSFREVTLGIWKSCVSSELVELRRFRMGRKYLEVLTAKMMLGMRKKVHHPRQNQKAFQGSAIMSHRITWPLSRAAERGWQVAICCVTSSLTQATY